MPPSREGLHASCRETTLVSPKSRAVCGLDHGKGLLRVLPQGACLFLRAEQLPPPSDAPDTAAQKADANLQSRRTHVRWAVEHVLFPAFKSRLVATKSLMQGGI